MQPTSTWSKTLYRLFFLLLALAALVQAKELFFIDQGDFDRVAWYFLEKSLDENHRIWRFKDVFEQLRFDISSLVFSIPAYIQKLYWTEYNLAFTAMLGQLLMLTYAHFLSKNIAELADLGTAGRIALLLIFSVSFFYSHNIAMLNSLYSEFIFMLALPLLVLGLISLQKTEGSGSAHILILLSGFFMGMAKTQYFYIPTLIALTFLLLAWIDKRKINYVFATVLLIIQIVCFIPLKKNDFVQLNYYHSLYFGSYTVLSEPELSALELSLESRLCIGTDAWGNKMSGAKGEKVEGGKKTCYKNQEFQIFDVLRPYILFPFTLVKMIRYSEAHWGTVQYFHVYPDSYYLKSLPRPMTSENILVRLSLIRDGIFNGFILIVMAVLGVASVFWHRIDSFVRYASFFLGAFFLSQLLVSIVGEGMRDLGKHMWAAQFSMDLMLALWLAMLVKRAVQRPLWAKR